MNVDQNTVLDARCIVRLPAPYKEVDVTIYFAWNDRKSTFPEKNGIRKAMGVSALPPSTPMRDIEWRGGGKCISTENVIRYARVYRKWTNAEKDAAIKILENIDQWIVPNTIEHFNVAQAAQHQRFHGEKRPRAEEEEPQHNEEYAATEAALRGDRDMILDYIDRKQAELAKARLEFVDLVAANKRIKELKHANSKLRADNIKLTDESRRQYIAHLLERPLPEADAARRPAASVAQAHPFPVVSRPAAAAAPVVQAPVVSRPAAAAPVVSRPVVPAAAVAQVAAPPPSVRPVQPVARVVPAASN
jgi:hypothetical protein